MAMSRFFNSALIASKPATQYSVCNVSKATPTVSFLAPSALEVVVEDLLQAEKRSAPRHKRRERTVFISGVCKQRFQIIETLRCPGGFFRDGLIESGFGWSPEFE